jgi:predicted Zn-dependent protease
MNRARLVIAAIIALFAIVTYYSSTSENPLTGETQRVAMTPEQEIALGYKSAPQMAAQMGGLSQNEKARALVHRVGEKLVAESVAAKSPYKFSFHLLADPRTVNAFALPGGPIFITEGLLRLLKSSPACSATRSGTSSRATPRSASPSSSSPRGCSARWWSAAATTARRRSARWSAA